MMNSIRKTHTDFNGTNNYNYTTGLKKEIGIKSTLSPAHLNVKL